MSYTPNDFKSPIGEVLPYCGTLKQCEFELVAAHIIRDSQKAGDWVRIKEFHPDYRTDEMIQLGFLEHNDEGYMLTEKALEKVHEKYPAKKD